MSEQIHRGIKKITHLLFSDIAASQAECGLLKESIQQTQSAAEQFGKNAESMLDLINNTWILE